MGGEVQDWRADVCMAPFHLACPRPVLGSFSRPHSLLVLDVDGEMPSSAHLLGNVLVHAGGVLALDGGTELRLLGSRRRRPFPVQASLLLSPPRR